MRWLDDGGSVGLLASVPTLLAAPSLAAGTYMLDQPAHDVIFDLDERGTDLGWWTDGTVKARSGNSPTAAVSFLIDPPTMAPTNGS